MTRYVVKVSKTIVLERTVEVDAASNAAARIAALEEVEGVGDVNADFKSEGWKAVSVEIGRKENSDG